MTRHGKSHFWRNWPQTHAFVCPTIFYPQSVGEIADAIITVTQAGRTIRAIGGGWSFPDASLPFLSQIEADNASVQNAGANKTIDLSQLIPVLNGNTTPQPIDLQPELADRFAEQLTTYDQIATTQVTQANIAFPVVNSAENVSLIDTKGLASSLQDLFVTGAAPI